MAQASVDKYKEDPAAELSLETIRRRSVSGVLALTSRTFFLQVVNFTSFAVFTALFTRVEFGAYGIVLAVRGFLTYFSDIGLAAALVQKKEKVTQEELKTTFIVQQMLVILLVAIGFAATPWLARWQQLTTQGVYLLWSFFIAFFISSLKTIPSVLLERKLEFTKLIIPQVLEAVVFAGFAILLALQGFGVISFGYAVLAQSVVGLVAMYILKPWKPGLAFSLESLRGLFKFGVPYQLNTFVAVVKDDGLIMFLGGVLGPGGVGLFLWAKKWGEAPLRFFMDQVIKVTFPAFARLQGNLPELSSALSRSIFFITLLVFPSVTGLILLAPMLTTIIPRYGQWQPALFALSLFGATAAIAAVTTPLTNMLNAVGKIHITFKLMLMWTALTWFIIPYLAAMAGVDGAAVGALVVGLSSFIAIWLAYRVVPFGLAYSVGKPLIATVVMGVVVYMLALVVPANAAGVFLLVLVGVFVYLVSLLALVGSTLISDGRRVLYAVLRR